jgi:rhodanese-related sulfurtransferase
MKKSIIILSVLQISLFGCGQEKDFNQMVDKLLSHSVTEISVDSAMNLTNAIFLDARAYREYEVSRIPNALWIGYKEFEPGHVGQIDLDATVIVYCSVGYRSEKITEELEELGFTNVSNLYGGIFDWVNQGQQIVNDKGPTNQVHGYNKKWGQWVKVGEKVYE